MEITTLEQYKDIINNNEKVLIDFYATWCGPCKMLAPILHEMDEAGEFGDVKFISIDVDKLSSVASMFNIQAIPTLIFIKQGKAVNSALGFMPKEKIKELISK